MSEEQTEYENLTSSMGEIVYDDSPNQTLFANAEVPSRRNVDARYPRTPDMGQDASTAPTAVAPTPAASAPPASNGKHGWGTIAATSLGVGALTALGVWGLMKWRGCPANEDAASIAQVGGVAALATAIGTLGVHYFLGGQKQG